MELCGKNIVIGVTGGIAAYKTCELVSSLKKKGANIDVLMTKSACEFVAPLTFEILSGNRVITDMFARDFSYDVEHISLAKKADVFLVVPATANFLGKMANGIADDMLTTTIMATKAPVILAPAMNNAMYENTIVQKNLNTLKELGVIIVEPSLGLLACGDIGKGKLAPISQIEEALEDLYIKRDLEGLNVLVTAGPTREALDPVRFISNHSTGKMGYNIAKSAQKRGANVTLVSGPVSIEAPNDVKMLYVNSAVEMRDIVLENMQNQHFIIKSAAVGDYKPKTLAEDKIKKKGADAPTIELELNPDILKEVCKRKNEKQVVCGFSMETKDLIENSREKLLKKGCQMMVANNLKVEGAGFGTDTNVVTFLYPDKEAVKHDKMPKSEVADIILDSLLEIYLDKK